MKVYYADKFSDNKHDFTGLEEEFYSKNEVDAAMGLKDEEIRLLRKQRDDLIIRHNYYVSGSDLDEEIRGKLAGEI